MAKTRTRPGPRRRPKRRNAAETVEVILEATRLLMSRGGVTPTTNAIAQRAGVSVGSIYQYFSNKEAIARELAIRQWRRALTRVLDAERRELPLEQRVRAFVNAICSSDHGEPALRRALLLNVPRSWIQETTALAHTKIRAVIEAQIADVHAKHEATPTATKRVAVEAFVLTHAVQGVVDAALIERPELLESDELREVLSSLVLRYLRG